MSDREKPETIGTRCQPELVDEFDQFKNEEGYGSRSEALRAVIIDRMEEREQQLISAREILKLEPLRAGSGLSLTVIGVLLPLVLSAVLVYGFLTSAVGFLWADVLLIAGLWGASLTFIFAPGAVLWSMATERAARRKRVLKRQAEAENPNPSETGVPE